MAGDGLGCADRFDELCDGVFGEMAGDVGFVDDADEAVNCRRREPANLMFSHHVEHFFDAGPGIDATAPRSPALRLRTERSSALRCDRACPCVRWCIRAQPSLWRTSRLGHTAVGCRSGFRPARRRQASRRTVPRLGLDDGSPRRTSGQVPGHFHRSRIEGQPLKRWMASIAGRTCRRKDAIDTASSTSSISQPATRTCTVPRATTRRCGLDPLDRRRGCRVPLIACFDRADMNS